MAESAARRKTKLYVAVMDESHVFVVRATSEGAAKHILAQRPEFLPNYSDVEVQLLADLAPGQAAMVVDFTDYETIGLVKEV